MRRPDRGCHVRARGLFVGATTVDLFYLVTTVPGPDEKMLARRQLYAAGGPATNAAVTFAWLGGEAWLLSGLGSHPTAAIARHDLASFGVRHVDLWTDDEGPPDVSVILVTASTGSRAIVSLPGSRGAGAGFVLDPALVRRCDVVLLDGYHLPTAIEVARVAASSRIPVVLDGGSWKPGLDDLLPHVSHAICAERFRPPGCGTESESLAYLRAAGIAFRAVTHGSRPIRYEDPGGGGEIAVPVVDPVVDTTGAGDVLHGAFCAYAREAWRDFAGALARAAEVASRSCGSFGTRAWIDAVADRPGPKPGGG